MKKKLGILTFHRAINCGAVLQAYALQKWLVKNGYDVKIIDYRYDAFEKAHNINIFDDHSLFRIVARSIEYKSCLRKINNYEKFQNEFLNTTEAVYNVDDIEQLCADLDMLVVGSDQVFNTDIIKQDPVFLLDFNTGALKISYAASLGKASISDKDTKRLKDALSRYYKISVREKSSISVLEHLISKKIEIRQDVDPTLLVDINDWNELISHRMVNQKYILVYSVHKASEELMDKAIEYANEHKCKIYAFNFYLSKKLQYYGKLSFVEEGPVQLLNMIKYAECIFTNSFHGTALSIALQKDFWACVNDGINNNIRVQELLKYMNLESRDLQCFELSKSIENSVWQDVENVLVECRYRAKELFVIK